MAENGAMNHPWWHMTNLGLIPAMLLVLGVFIGNALRAPWWAAVLAGIAGGLVGYGIAWLINWWVWRRINSTAPKEPSS